MRHPPDHQLSTSTRQTIRHLGVFESDQIFLLQGFAITILLLAPPKFARCVSASVLSFTSTSVHSNLKKVSVQSRFSSARLNWLPMNETTKTHKQQRVQRFFWGRCLCSVQHRPNQTWKCFFCHKACTDCEEKARLNPEHAKGASKNPTDAERHQPRSFARHVKRF